MKTNPTSSYGICRHVITWVTPAYAPRLAGIARYARRHGWHLTILDRIARKPRGWRGDGALVTLRDNPEAIEFAMSLAKRGIPVVDLTLNHPELGLPCVSGDHEAMGRVAREHFEERNFRNFAWFSTQWLNIHRIRCEAFARGDASMPRWVLSEEAPPEMLDDFTWIEKWLGAKLRASAKPLAILAYDDADAARVLDAALGANLSVPEEVAIIGIGGDRLICENQVVPLSSVEHDQGRTGFEGAALLDRLMAGGKPPREPILIQPRGVSARASTDILAATSPIVRNALAYIRTNIARSFGLAQVSSDLGVPRSTLARLFVNEVGRSIGEETQRQRIAAAKRLLVRDEKTIAEIAYATGFCNPGYFTNVFKAETGLSPREFKRANYET